MYVVFMSFREITVYNREKVRLHSCRFSRDVCPHPHSFTSRISTQCCISASFMLAPLGITNWQVQTIALYVALPLKESRRHRQNHKFGEAQIQCTVSSFKYSQSVSGYKASVVLPCSSRMRAYRLGFIFW